MKRFLALLLLIPGLVAAEKWTAFKSAPFIVITNAGDREAQEALVSLVQLRHTLSEKFGKELNPVWPLTVVQRKNNAEIGTVRLGRDSYLLTLPAGPVPVAGMPAGQRLGSVTSSSDNRPAIRSVSRVTSAASRVSKYKIPCIMRPRKWSTDRRLGRGSGSCSASVTNRVPDCTETVTPRAAP